MTIAFPTYETIAAALADCSPLPMAVADAGERHVIDAACAARSAGFIEPIFVGERASIESLLRERGEHPATIVAASNEGEAAERSVNEVLSGRARALMKGHLHTDTFLHPILAALRSPQRLSHVFVIEMERYGKPLLLTDGAINVAPDLTMKAAILKNAVAFAVTMGLSVPKVALLSAVEIVKATIPSTIDAAELTKMAASGAFAPALVAGPLAFDCVLSREASAIKGLSGPVPGDADIVLVPEIVAGNAVAKALEYGAGATLAGVVLGARVPVVLTSRADSLQTRLHSVALAAYQHHRSGAPTRPADGTP
ncbi:MAG: bifunctional enoyl-CoA hydratase/phosphate acetyltransferase [Candidatus Eremiobacteraeota bacterium]|nr:bifunctional enoyl-CoA hydratase/phosphate acetyltransferase [Candidatus Eremiobacteraeota bacterium]